MLDRHTLRSPQIYHNNPSISESEYRSTSKESKRTKMMASHIYLDENFFCNKKRNSLLKIFPHIPTRSFCIPELFKLEILNENYRFKWHSAISLK